MKYDYLDYEQIKKMGERIKISRKSNNMTQSELADILGISADQVSKFKIYDFTIFYVWKFGGIAS